MSEIKINTFEENLRGAIPYIDVTQINENTKFSEKMMLTFGEAGISQIVRKNVEKAYIGKQAALMSIVNKCILTEAANGIDIVVDSTTADGIKVSYPTEGGTIGVEGKSDIAKVKRLPVSLGKAEIRYYLTNETKLRGNYELLRTDSINDATEQLAAKIDSRVLTLLKAKADPLNEVTATDAWDDPAGAPDEDIALAIENILTRSAFNPETVPEGQFPFTLLLPIQLYSVMNRIRVIDGTKQTIGDFITTKHRIQIVYSRAPLVFDNTWPLADSGLLIPTFDRKVGRLHWFDGGSIIPNMFVQPDPNGEDITSLWWGSYVPAPDEVDGASTNNRRTAELKNLVTP